MRDQPTGMRENPEALMLWIRDGFRKNGNALMAEKLQPMSDAQISVLADYISRMPSPADTDQ